ncbi:MAG: hypothetical protein JRI91_05035 [Deltaproteobacteria bacterium]|nr:hypothetical protein [Deltaproteobacteria bacterium]
MTKKTLIPNPQHTYEKIKDLLIQARSMAFQTVNTEMVACYWNIGCLIIEEEQQETVRAEYAKSTSTGSIRCNWILFSIISY